MAERLDHPILHYLPPSFNSCKAVLASKLSQVADDVEWKWVMHIGENYTIEYARLNPDTMAVPTMQIDDKVITDSCEICKYLSQKYPSDGDQDVAASGRTAEMWAFVDFVKEWDEYVFTYGNAMSQQSGDFVNGLRLVNLKINLDQVLEEEPEDEEFLVEKYIQKIAGLNCMMRVQADGEDKDKELETNTAFLDQVLAYANRLLETSEGFLFGEKPCTADCFFLPILRIFSVVEIPGVKEEAFKKYGELNDYWERAMEHEEVHEGMMSEITGPMQAYMMLSKGVPRMMAAYQLGWRRAPELAEEIEERITKATQTKWAALRN